MKGNKLTVSMDMLLVLFSFILFVCSFLEVRNVIQLDTKVLNNIFMKNLEPIENISLGRNWCDNSKGYYSLFNYTFAGVNENCYDTNTHKFLNKSCSLTNNTIPIEGIPEKTLSIWRDKNICVKRMQNTTSNLKIVKDKCPEDYNQCGFINTNNNYNYTTTNQKILCVKNIIQCPINFFIITDDIKPFNHSSIYTIKELFNGMYLVFSNKIVDSVIPIDFKISEGLYPCLETERRSNLTVQFPLLNNLDISNCNRTHYSFTLNDTGYDTRYTKIDTVTKEQFFQDNDLDLDYRELPNITGVWESDIKSSYYSMFYRDFYNDKENCEGFVEFEKTLIKERFLLYLKLVINLSNIIVMVLFIALLSLVKVFSNFVHSLVFFVKIILCYALIAFNVCLIKLHTEKDIVIISDFINVENENQCFDELSKYTLQRYEVQDKTDSVQKVIEWEFWFNVCYGIFIFFEGCRFIHKVYVRIKNTYRRNIAVGEIGEENLQAILKEYRDKDRKERKRKKKEIDI